MGCKLLCLTLLALLHGCLGQKCTLITPNILRLESEETIVVDGHDKAFEAEVEIQDFPKRIWSLAKQKISLNNDNNFLGTATVTIPSDKLAKDPQKYVYVMVKSSVCNIEKVVLLSYQSGHAFIQTDKTIYKPGSTVLYRIFSINYKMSPMNTNLIIDFLTPENVIVNRYATIIGNSGIGSISFRLPEVQSLGVWTISAKYEDTSVQIGSTNFEVKEFVPPSYEITLIPEKKYFYVDDTEFTVNIKAKFLHGGPVNGMAFVIFGVNKDAVKTSLPNTLRRIPIRDGEGVAVLLSRDLVKNFKNDDDMLEYTLYMSITLITPAGSEIVESELEDINIVKSPYKVLFTKTAKYFKPGMPYDLKVFVIHPDGSPAKKVPVVAKPAMVQGITGEEGTVRLTLNTASSLQSLPITVKTANPALSDARQATASMTVNAYQSAGNYLYIGISGGEVKPGDIVSVNFFIRNSNPAIQNQIQHFTYLIMNKGRILKLGRQPRNQDQALVYMSLPITEEFTPSFRIIAYYMVGDEIVSDSIWVEITDSERCIGTLLVTGYNDRDNGVQSPGALMKLKLQADHKAYVGLVVIDKGLNVMSKNFKMSQKKIWDTMSKSDTGCTPGSGANSMGVFYDAGLALQSNYQATTQERSEPQCEVRFVRKRRSFNDDFDEGEYLPNEDIISRTEFPESWFWRIEPITEKPNNNGISTKILNIFLKDSITTWEVLAVSLSPNKGICVAKPYEIQVKPKLFIDLKVPYSVVRNEQVEIRAVIYNYGQDKVKVRVDLMHNPEFCSLSTGRKNYQQIVNIEAQSSVAVPFTLIPLSLGSHAVQVKASIFGQFVADGVTKKLKVVPEGVRIIKNVKLVTLEPQVKGTDGVQVETVPALDEKGIVPGTEVETIVTIQGKPFSQMEENVIDGSLLSHLIVVPRGSAESNMISLTPTVMATIYLDATNQWDRIGVNRRHEAIKMIYQGYVQQLVFRKADSSYAAFTSLPSSTWLTAFVVRVFAMAQSLVNIEHKVLCDSVKWLILSKQKPDGTFKEDARILHQDMVGDIKGSSEDVSLTAFVLIAMLESEKICTPHVSNLRSSIEKATNFLLSQYSGLTKPYTIAITSYALAMAGSIDQPERLLSGTTDKVQWESGSRFLTIEATSYALLALLHMSQYNLTGPIVRWITEQKYYGDVSSNTQATFVMFKALAQYQIDIPTRNDMDLLVTLNLPESNLHQSLKYLISPKTAMLARSATTKANKEFSVEAKGKGQATLTAMSVYYALETEKEKGCKNFDLTVTVKDEPTVSRPEGALSTLSVEICVRHLKHSDAAMSILDVSMMTGFTPDIESLNKLMKGVDKYISKFEINKESITKGTLIIYLDKISHTEEECIKFNVHQIFNVGQIQPASVTVYDYYSPENRCSKFYHVDKDSELLAMICQKDVCRCAEGNCFLQQQLGDEIDAIVRLQKVCDPGVDYVYKTQLEEIQHNDNYDNYVMKIISNLKEGSEERVLDKKRNFISHVKCRKALNLKKGHDYLIWGSTEDVWSQPSGYSYIIGKNTWIEQWPNEKECQNAELQNRCEDLLQFSEELEILGCRT
ncbi:A.superbus venom factor 1-like isoform X1 [Ranitomeya variabilis]|uniref:A.superbus venom factor 1-like isoform X1 n=2 Tax=Ranitomeya variabilis TaxID=490064 RepID=UPI0040565EAC